MMTSTINFVSGRPSKARSGFSFGGKCRVNLKLASHSSNVAVKIEDRSEFQTNVSVQDRQDRFIQKWGNSASKITDNRGITCECCKKTLHIRCVPITGGGYRHEIIDVTQVSDTSFDRRRNEFLPEPEKPTFGYGKEIEANWTRYIPPPPPTNLFALAGTAQTNPSLPDIKPTLIPRDESERFGAPALPTMPRSSLFGSLTGFGFAKDSNTCNPGRPPLASGDFEDYAKGRESNFGVVDVNDESRDVFRPNQESPYPPSLGDDDELPPAVIAFANGSDNRSLSPSILAYQFQEDLLTAPSLRSPSDLENDAGNIALQEQLLADAALKKQSTTNIVAADNVVPTDTAERTGITSDNGEKMIELEDEVLASSKDDLMRLDGEFDNSCQLSATLGEKPATPPPARLRAVTRKFRIHPLDRFFKDAYLSAAEFSDGDSIEQNLSNDLPSDDSSVGGNRSATSFFDDVDDADYQFNLPVEQDWQYAIFISTMRGSSKLTPEGVEELEVYSMRGGRMYLAVPSEQVTKRIANCELLRFKPDGKGMYMVKESTYRSGGVSGSLKVRQDRSVALKAIAICGFTGMSFEECMNQKKYIPLWCDLVGILRLEAIEAHRFNLRSIFTKNMFSALRVVRVSLECQHRSARSFDMMAAGWRVVNVESISHTETPTAGIPDCYWPAEAQRLDDITVDERLSDSCNLTLRSAHFPTRAIHAHVSQTTITPANRHMRMTALVVPVPVMRGVAKTEWHVLIAGPMQVVLNVTRDRLLNYSPKSYRDVIPPVDKDLVERVKSIGADLDRQVTILKPSPVFY